VIKIELEKLLNGRSVYWLSQKTGVRWATLAAMAKSRTVRLELPVLDLVCEALDCQPGDVLVRVKRRKARKK